MKKMLSIFAILLMIGAVACGPTAQEKAEKARLDSLNMADSIAQIEMVTDSVVDSLVIQ